MFSGTSMVNIILVKTPLPVQAREFGPQKEIKILPINREPASSAGFIGYIFFIVFLTLFYAPLMNLIYKTRMKID